MTQSSSNMLRIRILVGLDETSLSLDQILVISVSGVGRAVTRRVSNLKVRGSTLGLDEIFVRCFSVSPTHMESEKTEKALSVMFEVALVVNSLL